jgi:hypothetical protein
MSSVHYAELKRWDELYVLLIRKEHLRLEPGLYDIVHSHGPQKIKDLVTVNVPKVIIENTNKHFLFNEQGNVVCDGFQYDDEGILIRPD